MPTPSTPDREGTRLGLSEERPSAYGSAEDANSGRPMLEPGEVEAERHRPPVRDREQAIEIVQRCLPAGSHSSFSAFRVTAERIVDALLPQPDPEVETWTCPHGVTYSGSDEFLSGARNAHDEIANRLLAGPGHRALDGHRSANDIAQDIVDKAPEVEPFVEEWFAATQDRLNAGHVAKARADQAEESLRTVTEAARGVLEMLDGPGNALYAVPIQALRTVLSSHPESAEPTLEEK